jgi:hypothetical protein
MNKEQIIDEVYEQYWNSVETSEYDGFGPTSIKLPTLSKEEFINKCKTNPDFSEKWGLKIEERELSHEERQKWVIENIDRVRNSDNSKHEANKYLYRGEPLIYGDTVPTKLITITYKGETIESYE